MISSSNAILVNWTRSIGRLKVCYFSAFWKLNRQAVRMFREQIKYLIPLFLMHGVITALMYKGPGQNYYSWYELFIQSIIPSVTVTYIAFYLYWREEKLDKKPTKSDVWIFIMSFIAATVISSSLGYISTYLFISGNVHFEELSRIALGKSIIYVGLAAIPYAMASIIISFLGMTVTFFTSMYMLDELHVHHPAPYTTVTIFSVVSLLVRSLKNSIRIVLLELPCLILGSLLWFLFFLLTMCVILVGVMAGIALIITMVGAIMVALGFVFSQERIAVIILPLMVIVALIMIILLLPTIGYILNVPLLLLYHLYRSRNSLASR